MYINRINYKNSSLVASIGGLVNGLDPWARIVWKLRTRKWVRMEDFVAVKCDSDLWPLA